MARGWVITGPGGGENIVDIIIRNLQSLDAETRVVLKKKVCDELKYCEKLTTNRWIILQSIAGLVIFDLGAVSAPVLLIAVIAIKTGYIDQICECSPGINT